MTRKGSHLYVEPDVLATAPVLTCDRPPTKAEVWEYVKHVYGATKTDDELKKTAREKWASNFMFAVNHRGWDKHPDWVEGQPVIREATRTEPFWSGADWTREIERLWQIARDALARRSAA